MNTTNKYPPAAIGEMIGALETQLGMRVVSLYMHGDGNWFPDIAIPLYDALEEIGKQEQLAFYLRGVGGRSEVPWRIVALLREFADNLTILVPEFALSGATHVAISADRLIMGALSTLGPVDPQSTHPTLPYGPKGQQARVSVQDLHEFIEFATQTAGTRRAKAFIRKVFPFLMDEVNPLAIGTIRRASMLSRDITRRVLLTRNPAPSDLEIAQVSEALAARFWSHSFPVTRIEAEEELGLPVEVAPDELWATMIDMLRTLRDQGAQVSLEGTGEAQVRVSCNGLIDSRESRWVYLAKATAKEGKQIGVFWLRHANT